MKTRVMWCAAAAVWAAAAATGGIDAKALKWTLSEFARIEGDTLVVDVPKGKERGSHGATAVLDVSGCLGRKLTATVTASGVGVTKPAETWNGVKVGFHYRDTAGKDQWPGIGTPTGDFAARAFRVTADLRNVAGTNITFRLGLQSSSGCVRFDLGSLTFRRTATFGDAATVNQDYKVTYPARVTARGQLRGVMLPSPFGIKEDDFRTLRDWGATLVRYQINRGWDRPNANRDLAQYDKYIGDVMNDLDRVLRWAATYGQLVVIDLHGAPGARNEMQELRMYYEKKYLDHYVETWRRFARRYKGNPTVYGYDLINEPVQTMEDVVFDYWECQRRAAEAIREIDPDTPIIVESNGWDCAPAFKYLPALALPNVIYQFHMYDPGWFTHQGVHGKPAWPVTYPGTNGFNRAHILKALEPVIAFQKRHNARIYCGEFSAINWAPGADRYIADCCEIFNEFGWDWTFHAFREWNGWSVEHAGPGPDALRPSADNPRKRALLDGLNARPRPAKLAELPQYCEGRPNFAKAAEWVAKQDLGKLAPGRHAIDGERVYAVVSEYDTLPVAGAKAEAHRRYTDIQILLSGTERIGLAPVTLAQGCPGTPYDAKSDFALYDCEVTYTTLTAGEFIVLPPATAHLPGRTLAFQRPQRVRKLVLKVLND